MTIEDSLRAPMARGEHSCLADFTAARARLRARAHNGAWTGPCLVVPFPKARIPGPSHSAADGAGDTPRKGLRGRGEVVLLLPAVSAIICGCEYRAQDPTE